MRLKNTHTFSLIFILYYNYFTTENRFLTLWLYLFVWIYWIHVGRLYTQPYKLKDRHCKMGKAESPCFFYNGWVSVPLLRTTLLTRRFSTITRRAERARVSNGKGDGNGKEILSRNARWLMHRERLGSRSCRDFFDDEERNRVRCKSKVLRIERFDRTFCSFEIERIRANLARLRWKRWFFSINNVEKIFNEHNRRVSAFK